eukprot:343524-Amphidinium_carterae.1
MGSSPRGSLTVTWLFFCDAYGGLPRRSSRQSARRQTQGRERPRRENTNLASFRHQTARTQDP